MKVSFENIYEHIGYLFYGLARRNGELSTAQFVKLTDSVENSWRTATTGDPGLYLHLVDCIHTGIAYAQENDFSPEDAMTSFTNYFQIHSLPFSQPLKEKIAATAALIVKELPAWQNNELIKIDIEKLMGLKSLAV